MAGVVSAMAQYPANGYYRVRNYVTNRYIYVTDNRGTVDYGATSADVNALQVWKGEGKALCDPSSIIYFENGDGDRRYDLVAQGTSVYDIIGDLVNLVRSTNGTYMCYGKKANLAKYLGDIDNSNDEMGIMSIDATGDSRKWWVTPVDAAGSNYLGVKPAVQSKGKYYQPYYTAFPYSAYSAGVKFYAVARVQNGLAVIKEISGTVPAKTPVIVECASADPSANRLNLGGSGLVAANVLSGVFFNNPMESHLNRVKFDPATMRGLAVDKDGNLVYTDAPGYEYVPANTSYLKVAAGSPRIIKVVTEDRFEAESAITPVKISMGASQLALKEGESRQLMYTILPASAQGAAVTWTSSAPGVVSVSADGTVVAKSVGSATISATTANGLSAVCTVTVSQRDKEVETVQMNHASQKLYEGQQVQLTATVLPADAKNKTLVWSSSDAKVATVSPSGLVQAVGAGVCEIYATAANGVRGVCRIEVVRKGVRVESVTLSKTSLTLLAGESHKLEATVNPANADNRTVTWTSSNTAVATVSSDGEVTALAAGLTVIRAEADGVSATCPVTVESKTVGVESITMSETSVELTIGEQKVLTATVNPANAEDKKVTWKSSDTSVATVTSLGRVVARGEGVTEITASCGGKTGVCTVTVKRGKVEVTGVTLSHSMLTLEEGAEQQLVATVMPEDATDKSVEWKSSDAGVATVSASGMVKAVVPGWTSVTVTASGFVAVCTVKVIARTPDTVYPESVVITGAPSRMVKGEKCSLSATVLPADATDKSVQWSSSNSKVATVSAAGELVAVGGGRCVITASAVNGVQGSVEVEVTVPVTGVSVSPRSYEGVVGTEFELSWIVAPADASDKSVEVSSSDETVATVSPDGIVKLLRAASVVIRVRTTDGGFSDECTVNAVSSIADIAAEAEGAPLYNLRGEVVVSSLRNASQLASLPRGIYILRGKKIIL